MSKPPRKPGTMVGHVGRAPRKWLGAVNTPVFRASTILFPTMAELKAAAAGTHPGLTYGLHGLPTVRDILSELEKPGRDPRPAFRTAAFAEGGIVVGK